MLQNGFSTFLENVFFPQLRLALGVPTSFVKRNGGLVNLVPRPWFLESALPLPLGLCLQAGFPASVPCVAVPFAFSLPLGMLGVRVPPRHP